MNRLVLVTIVLIMAIIWFSALANACSPARAYGGSFWAPPVFIGGGGWNQGGWDRGTTSRTPPSSSPSRSSGGSIRGGGISGGSGGK